MVFLANLLGKPKKLHRKPRKNLEKRQTIRRLGCVCIYIYIYIFIYLFKRFAHSAGPVHDAWILRSSGESQHMDRLFLVSPQWSDSPMHGRCGDDPLPRYFGRISVEERSGSINRGPESK